MCLKSRLRARAAVYELKVAGLRPDEVRQTKAALDAGRAAVDSLTYQIETAAVLVSPVNGVVRTRMAEPGDMASAARTVYQISIMDPKWVRAYVSETQLKYVQEGAEALVTTDTTEPLKARVGQYSSEAEFTPKTVATQDLRTVLRLRGEAQRRGSGQPPASRPARDRGLRALNPPLEEKHVMTTSVIEASALCRVFASEDGREPCVRSTASPSPYRPRRAWSRSSVPDGAGKSTLMQMICGLVGQDSGSLSVLGRTPDPDDEDFVNAVGWHAADARPLQGPLPVMENMKLFGALRGTKPPEDMTIEAYYASLIALYGP